MNPLNQPNNALSNYSGLVTQGVLGVPLASPQINSQIINEPNTIARAGETLNHIATLEQHVSVLFGDLFGMGQSTPQRADPPSHLDAMLAQACERAALLCGSLATLRQRLGCTLDPPVPPPSR